MRHHRRKALLKSLNTMYLENVNRSKTYSEFMYVLHCMTIVTATQTKQLEATMHSQSIRQLELFA